MKTQTKSQWSSLDIHTAAYLEFRGIAITLESISGRIVFTADHTDELYRLLAAFNQNDPVPIIDYIATLRSMKARMFAARASRSEAGRG